MFLADLNKRKPLVGSVSIILIIASLSATTPQAVASETTDIEPVSLQGPWPWLTYLPWTTGDTGSWWVDESGKARSPDHVHEQVSWLETTVRGPGTLSFDFGLGGDDSGKIDFIHGGILRSSLWTYGSEGNGSNRELTAHPRVGPGSVVSRWEYSHDAGSAEILSGGWLDRVEYEPRHRFELTATEAATRIEIRGMSADGTVLVGTVHEGDLAYTYPAFEIGTGGMVKFFCWWNCGGDADGWFATASDILPDGSLAVGRIRRTDNYPAPALWLMTLPIPQIILPGLPAGSHTGVGMALGIGGSNGDIIVGRAWSNSGWQATVWIRDPDGGLAQWNIESAGTIPGFESDSWLYSISRDGRVAAGWAENWTTLTIAGEEKDVKEMVPTGWTPADGIRRLPMPSIESLFPDVKAYYVSSNGRIIVGNVTVHKQNGDRFAGTVLWWADGHGGWTVEVLPPPPFIESYGDSPLPRITDDGLILSTRGVHQNDLGEESYWEIIWTRFGGWNWAYDYLIEQGFIESGEIFDGLSMGMDGQTFALVRPESEAGPASATIVYHPHPLVHESMRLGGDWYWNEWLGAFAVLRQWLYHPLHGWLYFNPAPGSGHFIFHLDRQAWSWTTSASYPLLHWLGDAAGWATGDMVLVEGGTLSTTNLLNGTVVETFYIGQYEVTWGEWKAVRAYAAANGYDLAGVGIGCANDHPVHSVNWYDAVKWSNARSEMEGLTPVYTVSGAVYRTGEPDHTTISQDLSATGYRLPLEAEWEFAARGGNQTNGYTYSGSNDLNAVGWHRGNSRGAACSELWWSDIGIWPVGQKEANELGLYDLSGNVWEWCWDRWSDASSERVRRGGSWLNLANSCTVSWRYSDLPSNRSSIYGFRLALSAGQ